MVSTNVRCFLVERVIASPKVPDSASAAPTQIEADAIRLPPGAMFWISGRSCEHDPTCERHLCVSTPGGAYWDIDGRSSNCAAPHDRQHRCWVRTGEPPDVTVGKNGLTCGAGTGSIDDGEYHGYLVDGVFTEIVDEPEDR